MPAMKGQKKAPAHVRKLDAKNRIVLPTEIIDKVGANHFAVEKIDGRIILTPIKIEAWKPTEKEE